MVLEAKAPRAGEGVSGGGISSLLGSRLPLHTFGRPQLNIITRNEDPGNDNLLGVCIVAGCEFVAVIYF